MIVGQQSCPVWCSGNPFLFCVRFETPSALVLPERKNKKFTRLFYKNPSKLLTIYLPVDLMAGCTNDCGQTNMSSLMLWKPLFDLAFGLRSPFALVLPERKNKKIHKAVLQEPK